MNTKIRQGVFETNSSSSHAISICMYGDDELMDLSFIPDDNGNIILNGGSFGWEKQTFYDAQTKASYVAVGICDCSANIKKNFTALLEKVIKSQTGCNKVIFNFSTENYSDNNYSYIDHESSGVVRDALKNEKTLKNFIFNKKSVLITHNDNESVFYTKTCHMLDIIIENISNLSFENYKDILEETVKLADICEDKLEYRDNYDNFIKLISRLKEFNYSDNEKESILKMANSIRITYYKDSLDILIEDIKEDIQKFTFRDSYSLSWEFETYYDLAMQLKQDNNDLKVRDCLTKIADNCKIVTSRYKHGDLKINKNSMVTDENIALTLLMALEVGSIIKNRNNIK